MTGHELARKLLTLPDVDVKIQITVTYGGSEYTGCWDDTEYKDIGGVDDLETRIILTPEK